MLKFRRILLKLFSFFTAALLLTCCSFITVFSATSADFTLSDCNTDNNRLFTITMTAFCDKKLSAASFEFTYDKSMFEFRSAKVSDESSKIMSNELDDKVKLVFLNSDGLNITNGESIFTLTFKAIKSGTGYIDFYVSDCVDSDINSIDAGNCTSAEITVNSKSNDSSSDKSNNSEKSSKNESSSVKSVRSTQQETTSVSTVDELGRLNSFDNQNTRFLIIGIALGAMLIAVVILLYFLIRKLKFNRDKRKDSPDD